MRDRVCKAQSAAPGPAENVPSIYPELFTKYLDIVDEVPRCIFTKLSMRRRSTGAALVKQHNVIGLRVEELPVHRDQAPARPAVKKYDRYAIRVSRSFVINAVNVRYVDHARIEGLNFRIE